MEFALYATVLALREKKDYVTLDRKCLLAERGGVVVVWQKVLIAQN